MARLTTTLLAAAAAAALTAPAVAGAPAPQLTDQRGDANAVNHQAYAKGMLDPSRPTEPASYAAGDILSVQWATAYARRRPVAVTVTLTLAAPPAAGTSYFVNAATPRCGSYFRVEYDVPASAPAATTAFCGTAPVAGIPPARVTGSRIVWTLPLATLSHVVRTGDVFREPWAETRLGAVHPAEGYPSADGHARVRVVVADMAYGDGTYRVG